MTATRVHVYIYLKLTWPDFLKRQNVPIESINVLTTEFVFFRIITQQAKWNLMF